MQNTEPIETGLRKREIAYKLRIGNILNGNPIIEERATDEGGVKERFRFLELGSKEIVRVNIIANVVDKFTSEGERRFATMTLDDASGQIQARVFGEDTAKFQEINHGDTLLVIGMLRSFNREVYILPEIIKKTDARYLLIRKLETENLQLREQNQSALAESQEQPPSIKEQIAQLIKAGDAEGGVDTEQLILRLKDAPPETINAEIIKLLENGIIYEPRPGRVRWLG